MVLRIRMFWIGGSFYMGSLDIIDDDFCKIVKAFLKGDHLPRDYTVTAIALIPKVKKTYQAY